MPTTHKKRERSRLADAIAACLLSGNDTLHKAALAVLRRALRESNGVVSRAAVELGISERAFRRWLADDEVREALRVPRMFVKAP